MKNLKQIIDEVVDETVVEWTSRPLTPTELYDTIKDKAKARNFDEDEHFILGLATRILQIIWM